MFVGFSTAVCYCFSMIFLISLDWISFTHFFLCECRCRVKSFLYLFCASRGDYRAGRQSPTDADLLFVNGRRIHFIRSGAPIQSHDCPPRDIAWLWVCAFFYTTSKEPLITRTDSAENIFILFGFWKGKTLHTYIIHTICCFEAHNTTKR